MAIAALIALLLHALLLVVLWNLPEAHPVFKDIAEPQKIQVHLSPPKDTKPQKQLVKIPPPKEDKVPRKADYLSESNSSVPKETQAQNKSPTPTTPRWPIAPRVPPPTRGPGQKHNLLPTWQDLERLQPQPQTAFNDHIEKAETAAQTELNTFEWKHAAYFNRIKESVARVWSPMLQMRRYDPGAALIGKQDRMTILEITLDGLGNVVSTQIKSSSGVFYLDDEAVNSFRKASPFPNPPKILFASGENFSFTFGFIVNVQKGFSLNFD